MKVSMTGMKIPNLGYSSLSGLIQHTGAQLAYNVVFS